MLQAAERCAQLKTLLRDRAGDVPEHRVAIIGTHARARKERPVEHIERDIVAIRPDPPLRIVRKSGVGERVAVVGTGGVRCSGDSHALIVRRPARDRELSQDPAIGRFVILGDWIAVIELLAWPAETIPEGVAGRRAIDNATGALIENREIYIDPLDVLI